MKIKRLGTYLAWAFMLCLAVAACKKDNDIRPNPGGNGGGDPVDTIYPPLETCYLTRVEQAYTSGGNTTTYITTYTYNSHNQVEGCVRTYQDGRPVDEHRYIYEDTLIQRYEYYDSKGQLQWYSEFKYGNGRQVSNEFSFYKSSSGEFESSGSVYYEYNADGRVSKAMLAEKSTATATDYDQYITYEYDERGNNIRRSFYDDDSELIEAYIYEYDGVKSAYLNERMPAVFMQYRNPNNVVRFFYEKDSYKFERYTATYKKNAREYPTSCTQSYNDGSRNEMTYTYHCK